MPRSAADLDQELPAAGRLGLPAGLGVEGRAGWTSPPASTARPGRGGSRGSGRASPPRGSAPQISMPERSINPTAFIRSCSAGSDRRSLIVCEHITTPTPTAVQPGERVGAVDHPAAGDQRPPQLVENDQVVAHRRQTGLRQGVRRRSPPRTRPPSTPTARRRRAPSHPRESRRRRTPPADPVQPDGAVAGEHLPDPSLAEQRLQRDLQRLDELAVALDRPAVKRRRSRTRSGALFDGLQQIAEHRGSPGDVRREPAERRPAWRSSRSLGGWPRWMLISAETIVCRRPTASASTSRPSLAAGRRRRAAGRRLWRG